MSSNSIPKTKPSYLLRNIWRLMIRRCHDSSLLAFKWYGARGIAVCLRWRESFEAFKEDVGPRPSMEHELDRINNDGNYEPGNVRWATLKEQARNKTTSRRIDAFGEVLTLVEWSEKTGINQKSIKSRLSRGWDAEDALSQPLRLVPVFHANGKFARRDANGDY